jgi:hypothetical protein
MPLIFWRKLVLGKKLKSGILLVCRLTRELHDGGVIAHAFTLRYSKLRVSKVGPANELRLIMIISVPSTLPLTVCCV